jgi:DnaJ-domain-containing protein 1
METFIIFIKISFFAIAVIAAIVNKKQERENIAVLKYSNNTLSLILRIVASIAFDNRRNIDINNLSNREKNILSIVLEIGNEIGIKEKDDIQLLLRSFVEISRDHSVYTDVSIRKDIEILLERECGNYDMLECIFRVCMAVSVDEKGNLLEKKKDKLKFLHKNLGIRYNIFDNDNNSSVEDSSKNEYEKYYIILQCSTEASLDDIKNSYRKLSKEYHPDMLASKGLPEDIIRYSQERFNSITEAKDILVKKLNEEIKINNNKGQKDSTENNSTFRDTTNNYRNGEKCANESCNGVIRNNGRCSNCGCLDGNINISMSILKGRNHLRSSQFSDAIIYFEKAIKLDGENSLCYYYRAVAYSKIKDNKKATADLKISAKLGCRKAIDTLNKHNINYC